MAHLAAIARTHRLALDLLIVMLEDDSHQCVQRARIVEFAECFDGLVHHVKVSVGRNHALERGKRLVRGLIAKCLRGLAPYFRIVGVVDQIGQRRNRLRRLHLADRLGRFRSHLRQRIGTSHAQQDLYRARIVMVAEPLGGFVADAGGLREVDQSREKRNHDVAVPVHRGQIDQQVLDRFASARSSGRARDQKLVRLSA